MSKVKVGDAAPDFALSSQTGETVRLSEFAGKRNVVLYFYPKDFTTGCTAEAGAFRDGYESFKNLDAEVLGISADSVESHRRFSSDCKLPFKMLSDAGKEVRELYGVPTTLGLIPGRVTFVIDKEGIVREVFSSQLQPTRHAKEAMEALRRIGAEEQPAQSARQAAGTIGASPR
jgi:thioredoxin-dependent peroxiredoxin